MMREFARGFKAFVDESLEGKGAWWRALLLLWTGLILRFVWKNEPIPGPYNPLWVVSHGIHEIGHWVTMPFGQWVSVASGSLFQFLFPFVFIVGMLKHRDPHGASVLLTWQAASCLHMAHYAGSAEYSDLILDTPHYITLYHDWVWMLSNLNAIGWARTVEDFFWWLALGFGILSALGQGYCLWRLFKSQAQTSS